MTYFFTADEHYGHVNAIEYNGRPFANVNEMDEALIRNHNEVVCPDDITVHVGDFSLIKNRGRVESIIMHMPPAGVGLSGDKWTEIDRPESKAILDFLVREQPLLSLHGHIHASFKMTGIWKVRIGDTWAVQPGQDGLYPVYCIIDTEDLGSMERHGYKSEPLFLDVGEDLPEYLEYHFSRWLKGAAPSVELFEKFVLEKGLKIKLMGK